jgi:hypothetical protein
MSNSIAENEPEYKCSEDYHRDYNNRKAKSNIRKATTHALPDSDVIAISHVAIDFARVK